MRRSAAVALLIASSAAGCGGSTTTVIERQPQPTTPRVVTTTETTEATVPTADPFVQRCADEWNADHKNAARDDVLTHATLSYPVPAQISPSPGDSTRCLVTVQHVARTDQYIDDAKGHFRVLHLRVDATALPPDENPPQSVADAQVESDGHMTPVVP